MFLFNLQCIMKLMRKLSQSLEDYLETILILENEGKRLHSIEIARRLNVSKPAVTNALKRLARRGYVTKVSYEDVTFTKEGRSLARKIYHRHITIYRFLISIGVDEHTAKKDCCRIEHIISEQTLQALSRILNKVKE